MSKKPIRVGRAAVEQSLRDSKFVRGLQGAMKRLEKSGLGSKNIGNQTREAGLELGNPAVMGPPPEIWALQQLSPCLKAVTAESESRRKRLIAVLGRLLQRGLRRAVQDLEALGYGGKLRELEDWEDLACCIEIPPDRIGTMTLNDIYRHAKAWHERKAWEGRIAVRGRKPESEASPALNAGNVTAKKSTSKGDAEAKLIAALTQHHRYANESCLNPDPIGNNELARLANVSRSTASAFMRKSFQGHTRYAACCRDSALLLSTLKLLNRDFAPYLLYGGKPPPQNDDRE